MLTQRPSPGDPGYFLLLLSPQATPDDTNVPRDLVVVLDTSGSMDQEKLQQAKAAVIHALDSLGPDDRFAVIAFATTTKSFRENLAAAEKRNLRDARMWVEKLRAEGGTDIADGLESALRLREKSKRANLPGRSAHRRLAHSGRDRPEEDSRKHRPPGRRGHTNLRLRSW